MLSYSNVKLTLSEIHFKHTMHYKPEKQVRSVEKCELESLHGVRA